MQKLQNVLEKLFSRFGTIVRRYYPVDEATQMFKGYGIKVTVFCMYVRMYVCMYVCIVCEVAEMFSPL